MYENHIGGGGGSPIVSGAPPFCLIVRDAPPFSHVVPKVIIICRYSKVLYVCIF